VVLHVGSAALGASSAALLQETGTDRRELAMSADARMHQDLNDQLRLLYGFLGKHVRMLDAHACTLLSTHAGAACARGGAERRGAGPPQIVCTIHQPSSDICNMFDDLILMSCGRLLYCGSWMAADTYFADAGFKCAPAHPACPCAPARCRQGNTLATPCCLR